MPNILFIENYHGSFDRQMEGPIGRLTIKRAMNGVLIERWRWQGTGPPTE
jgi:hypothetical protein